MKNLLIIFALVLFTSCNSDDSPKDYTVENEQEIQAYLEANNLVAQKSSSGLYYIIETPGTGENPIGTDRVFLTYKGYYTNGTVFDENTDGVSFDYINGLIIGFAEGLTYLKEGGSGKLFIPSNLAYGNSDYNGIPGGSVLIFDVELIYVNYTTENDEEIQTYLSDNDLTAEKTDTGLYYTISTVGEGEQPTATDTVTITYKGYFTDDAIFDESTENVNFAVDNLIPGFAEGLTYLNAGGSGTFYVPSHLAYGNLGNSSIPRGAVVIFDVDLISIN
ncbi:FKBP-type peptidyl-prolyl cis-trans isomerase [Algibacter sp.]|uniref:FKBP-type peptidyl-prolyl cis-trans isomerase n=1 Tax=Algibacter sp. TaxID=1872428 RepID=UPI003C7927AA